MKRTLLALWLLTLCLPVVVVFGQDGEATLDEERITFDVSLSEDRGGGRVQGSAGNIELREGQYLLATGGVELKFRDLELTAELARVDIPTNLLTAEGNVVLDEGPQRLTGDKLEYDLTTQTGKVTQATAFVDPDYYFSGSQIAKIGPTTYTVNDGVFTSCEQEVPSWSFHLKDANITLGEYARIRHATMKFGKLPVLYVPYMLWPATTERTSGFLVPKPGYSQRFGAELDLAYYKTLGRSADTTFFLDLSSKEFFGLGNEIRYRPSENTKGYFRAYYLFEPDDFDEGFFNPIFDPDRQRGDDRWKIEFFHESKKLWGDFRGVVNLQEYSDLDYLQDFERDVRRQTRSFIYSNAFLSRNVGQTSLNIQADQREQIRVNATDIRRQLPEVEFRVRPTRLGRSPVYFSLDSSLHYFSIEQQNFRDGFDDDGNPIRILNSELDEQYGRGHIAPEISIPISNLSWLSAKLNVGGRATFYSDTLTVGEDNTVVNPREFSGESLTRTVGEGSLEIIGPIFSRIFEKDSGRFSKLKHIIEPRITYNYLDEFEEQSSVFLFDEVDQFTPTNGVVFSLINRLMAKSRPTGEDEDEGGAVEIGSFEVRQAFSFDDARPFQVDLEGNELSEGPISMVLRLNPSTRTSFKTEMRYDTANSEVRSLRVSGSKIFGGFDPKGNGRPVGGHRIGLSWFSNFNAMGDTTNNQARLFTRFSLLPRRLSLEAEVTYDFEGIEKKLIQQRYFLDWKSQCYSWRLEFRESMVRSIEDRDIRFSLTLKNVGTFLDLNENF